MTDRGDWPDLIERKGGYIMVPLNEYQIGNLLDAITQAQTTGDWWWEWVSICSATMQKLGIKEVGSNRGLTFSVDNLYTEMETYTKRKGTKKS